MTFDSTQAPVPTSTAASTAALDEVTTPSEVQARNVPRAKVTWANKKRVALKHADQLTKTNPTFSKAKNAPADAFEMLAKMGFTLSIGAQARKAPKLKWKQPCCQIKWDSSTESLAWASTVWASDVEVYDPTRRMKVKCPAGSTRHQSRSPVAIEQFDTPIIVMEGDMFAIDLDWPNQILVGAPPEIGTYTELLALLLAHPSFKEIWANMVGHVGEDGAMTWLQGQLIQRTGKNGFQLIGMKSSNNELRQVTGALARKYNGPVPEGYDEGTLGPPLCKVDTRGTKEDGTTAGMVFGPGTVISLDDKVTDKTGEVFLVERSYKVMAGSNLTLETMAYLPDATANFIAANTPNNGNQDQAHTIAAPTGLAPFSAPPKYGKLEDGVKVLADSMNSVALRDAELVKEQLCHSISLFAAEYAATQAAIQNGSAAVVRSAPQYEDYMVFMNRVMWPILGSIVLGEFGNDDAKAEEIGKSLLDTATQMFAAAGIDTSKNDELWTKGLQSARERMAERGEVCRAGRIELDAKACGWVPPAITPSALLTQPITEVSQTAPTTDGTGASVSVSGRKRVQISKAPATFAPAKGTPTWAVSRIKGKAPNQAVVPVASESTASQAVSYLGIGGKFNELDNVCEIDIPAELELAGMPIGLTPLTPPLARAVNSKVELKWGTKFGHKLLADGMRAVAEQSPYNPVAEYLKDCQPKEGICCRDLFRKYFNVQIGHEGEPPLVCPITGAREEDLADEQSELTMVALVARAIDPGGEFQQVPVMVSHKQGVNKSNAWKALVPNKRWHGDSSLFGLQAKEIAEVTAGKWLQECPEMVGFSKTSSSQLKDMISRTADVARMAYAQDPSMNLRRWLMVCTSNVQYFLNDPSGDRRFWPWLVTMADVEAIRRDRDALWADAYRLFMTKYHGDADLVVLDEKYYNLTDMVRERFTAGDPKEMALRKFTAMQDDGNIPIGSKILSTATGDHLWFSSIDLLRALVGPHAKLTKGTAGEVADIMRRLGWTSKARTKARGWWRRLTPNEQTAYNNAIGTPQTAPPLSGAKVASMMPQVPAPVAPTPPEVMP